MLVLIQILNSISIQYLLIIYILFHICLTVENHETPKLIRSNTNIEDEEGENQPQWNPSSLDLHKHLSLGNFFVI